RSRHAQCGRARRYRSARAAPGIVRIRRQLREQTGRAPATISERDRSGREAGPGARVAACWMKSRGWGSGEPARDTATTMIEEDADDGSDQTQDPESGRRRDG